jgi:hypothetical protein
MFCLTILPFANCVIFIVFLFVVAFSIHIMNNNPSQRGNYRGRIRGRGRGRGWRYTPYSDPYGYQPQFPYPHANPNPSMYTSPPSFQYFPPTPQYTMHQAIIQAQIKTQQEQQDKMIQAAQQVLKQYDQNGNLIVQPDPKPCSSTSNTTEIQPSISISKSTSEHIPIKKKQKILDLITKAFYDDNEEDSSTQIQTKLIQEQTVLIEQQQTQLKHLQKQINSMKSTNTSNETPKTKTRKRKQTPSPISSSSSDSDSEIEIIKRTPKQQKEYDIKLQNKIKELTTKYAGRSSAIRQQLENDCGQYKILPDMNRKNMITKLAMQLIQ